MYSGLFQAPGSRVQSFGEELRMGRSKGDMTAAEGMTEADQSKVHMATKEGQPDDTMSDLTMLEAGYGGAGVGMDAIKSLVQQMVEQSVATHVDTNSRRRRKQSTSVKLPEVIRL